MLDPLPSDKPSLRRVMKQRRAEAFANNPSAGIALRDQFLQSVSLPPQAIVAGYIAIDHEINPQPLLDALAMRGHALCLPVMAGAPDKILFHAYKPGDALIADGEHAIPQPPAS